MLIIPRPGREVPYQKNGTFDGEGVSAHHTYGDSGTYTVRLRVTDNRGAFEEVTRQTTVTYPLPTVSLNANPPSIILGRSTTLTWTSTHADTCVIEPGLGNVPVNGSTTVAPSETTTYTITVNGPGGSASSQALVKVMGEPEPQLEGSFGEQYQDLIPDDATVESYDPKRFSVINGMVQAQDGSPLEGVSITIHGHPVNMARHQRIPVVSSPFP